MTASLSERPRELNPLPAMMTQIIHLMLTLTCNVQVFMMTPVQHGATVEQKLRNLIAEVFHRLPTNDVRLAMQLQTPCVCVEAFNAQ